MITPRVTKQRSFAIILFGWARVGSRDQREVKREGFEINDIRPNPFSCTPGDIGTQENFLMTNCNYFVFFW